jgi:hypothetical protein
VKEQREDQQCWCQNGQRDEHHSEQAVVIHGRTNTTPTLNGDLPRSTQFQREEEKAMAGKPKHDEHEDQPAPSERPAESDQSQPEAKPAPDESPGVPPLWLIL